MPKPYSWLRIRAFFTQLLAMGTGRNRGQAVDRGSEIVGTECRRGSASQSTRTRAIAGGVARRPSG